MLMIRWNLHAAQAGIIAQSSQVMDKQDTAQRSTIGPSWPAKAPTSADVLVGRRGARGPAVGCHDSGHGPVLSGWPSYAMFWCLPDAEAIESRLGPWPWLHPWCQ